MKTRVQVYQSHSDLLSQRIRSVPLAAMCGLAVLCGGGLLPQTVQAEGGPKLVSHEAVYDVALIPERTGGMFTNVTGATYINLRETCDGWEFSNQMTMTLALSTGAEFTMDIGQDVVENSRSDAFTYVTNMQMNGQAAPSIEGDASLAADGTGGQARFVSPIELTIDLPAETLFPVKAMKHVLGHAQTGVRHSSGTMFTGVGPDTLYDVTAFITGYDRPVTDVAVTTDTPDLLSVPAYRVEQASFIHGVAQELPDHEIQYILLDNGISPSADLHFDGFSIRTSLKELRALPAPEC